MKKQPIFLFLEIDIMLTSDYVLSGATGGLLSWRSCWASPGVVGNVRRHRSQTHPKPPTRHHTAPGAPPRRAPTPTNTPS